MRSWSTSSVQSILVTTYPEMTKNTSTPTNPPGTGSPAWNRTTRITATARRPCTSPRRPVVIFGRELDSLFDGARSRRIVRTQDLASLTSREGASGGRLRSPGPGPRGESRLPYTEAHQHAAAAIERGRDRCALLGG